MSDWADSLGQPAGSPEPSGGDWADSLTATKSNEARTLDANLMAPTTPDRSAKVLELHKKTGLPINLVDSQLETVEQEARKSDFDSERFTKENPVVSKWMNENPQQASLGVEDRASLSATEKMLRFMSPVYGIKKAFEEDRVQPYIEQAGKSLGASVFRMGGASAGLFRAAAELRYLPAEIAAHLSGLPPEAGRKIYDVMEGGTTKEVTGFLGEQQQIAEDWAKYIRGDMSKFTTTEQAVFSGVESAGQNIVNLAAGILTKNPQIVLSLMSSQTAGEAYGQAREKGVSVGKSLVFGTAQGSVEYATELLPMMKLMKDLGLKTSFVRTLVNQAPSEIVGEQVATVLQDFNEWATLNPETPFSDYADARGDAAYQTLVATVTAMVGLTGAGHVISRAVNYREARQQEDFFRALGDVTKNTKLRERLPEQYRTLVDEMTKDGPVENVYTPIEFFQTQFQTDYADAREVAVDLGIENAYDEAVATGSKLAIPMSIYATKIAPTEHNAAFVKELAISADGLTAREAEELQKEFEQAKTKEPDAFEQSVLKVREDVLKQLQAIMPSDVAEHNATLWEARYRARAERLGVDPWTLYQQQAKTFTREGDVSRGTPIKIVPSETLTEPENKVQTRFAQQIEADPEGMKQAYIASNTNEAGTLIINTDQARELSDDYRASMESRSTLSSAVHEPASALVKALYEDALKQPPAPGHDPVVVFFGGGTGAGKSTAVKQIASVNDDVRRAQMIFDTNMNGFKSAKAKIDAALKAGKTVSIVYVHRDPVVSLIDPAGGSLHRAERMGRTVPLKEHIATHVGAKDTIQQIAEHYKDNPDVDINIIDNRGGKGEARLATLEVLKETSYNRLEERLNEELDKLYRQGRVSERVYRGTKGLGLQRAVEEDGKGVRGQPQPQREGGQPAASEAGRTAEGISSSDGRGLDVDDRGAGLSFAPSGPDEFYGAISQAKSKSRFGSSVFVYPKEDYAKMQTFLLPDKSAGYALKGDDLVSVFSNGTHSNVADTILKKAVEAGAKRLDAFDTRLPFLYGKNGFKAVARLKWNDEFAPPDWDKETYKKFNNGEPDVVFMVYDAAADQYKPGDGKLVADYDEAIKLQDRALKGEQEFFQSGKTPQTETPEFKRWFGDSKVADEDGMPLVVYHGTTHDFKNFTTDRGNPESDFGKGFYFSNNTEDVGENYAGEGPDLTQRIELRAERIINELEDDSKYKSWSHDRLMNKARKMARKELSGGAPNVMPVYLSFQNPVIIGGENETIFDVEIKYDIESTIDDAREEMREKYSVDGELTINEESFEDEVQERARELSDENNYTETGGPLLDFIESLTQVASRFNDTDNIMDTVASIQEQESIGAEELVEILKKSEGIIYATDDEGNLSSGELIRQAFEHAGYDGIIDNTVNRKFGSEKRVGRPMAGMDYGTVHYIAFQPEQIKSAVGNRGTFDQNDPNILHQPERGVTRATQRTVNIELLKNADLSTMLHESGHVFLLEMYDDVQYLRSQKKLTAKQQALMEDFNKLLNWLGVTEQELLDRSKKSITANEKFARGFEAYLAEGKAPSAELRSSFQRFKAWLVHVYRLWKNDPKVALDVHLNDEVRGIMDRLLATDEQIMQAQQEAEVTPVFTDAVEAGMSDTEFAAYQKTLQDAHAAAQEELEQSLMREFQRERTKWWKEERAKIRAVVEAEVDQRPIYKALAELKREGGLRLDRKAIDKDRVRMIPTGIAVKEGGIDPQTAAEMLGFKSGEDLINQLSVMQSRNKLIEAQTDQRMQQEHGNMLLDGSIYEKAKEAVRGEMRSEVIRKELTALQKKAREAKPMVDAAKKEARDQKAAGRQIFLAAIPTVAQARDTAQRTIAGTRIRDIRPMQYFAAARKSSKAALEAVNKGDFILAAVLKRQELIANEMYRAAIKAQSEVKKITDYLKKFEKKSTRERIGKAGEDFLDQIDALLARYNLHPQSETVLRKKKATLQDWYQAQVDLGFEPTIDPDLMDEARRVNYRDVPLEDLQAIQDAVKSIEYVASRIGKMNTIMGEREFDDVVSSLIGRAEETLKKIPKAKEQILKSWLDRKKDMLKGHDTDLVSVETLIELLDGGAVGPWHDFVFNTASEAQSNEYDMAAKYGDVIGKVIDEYIDKDTGRVLDMIQTDLEHDPMSRYKLISIAFNIGNESNMEKLAKGNNWTEAQIMEAVKLLHPDDLAFVQKIWDTLDTFYPKLNELQKRVSGVTLARVEPRAVHVTLKDGTKVDLRGGYYPVYYDPDFSAQGQKQDTGPLAGLTERGYARATAPDSFRKGRTKFAAPMRFDFGYVLQKHLSGVMKDLSHREFLIDLNRLLKDKRIRKVLQERLGRDYEQMFMPWLKGIANDRNVSPADLTGWDKRFEAARSHVTVVALGFKVTSMLAQVAGISNSLEYISDNYGSRYLVGSLMDFIKSPFNTFEMVKQKSGEMRHRFETIDREVRDELRRLSSAHPIRGLSKTMLAKEMFERSAFYGINFMDRLVAIPTWMAAYQGALDQIIKESPGMNAAEMERKAIHAGDAAVRRTQGAGGAKDLSTIQRKRGVMKILTMFYTPFAAWYGRLRSVGSKLARADNRWKYAPEAVIHVALITMIPTVMAELLAGRGPEECDKKEGGDYAGCFGRWAAIKSLFSLAAPIPVVRDVGNTLESVAIDGRPRDTRFSPVLDAINRVAKTGERTGSVIFGDKKLEDDLVFDLFETSGYFMGFPTGQPRITLEYLYDLMTDEAKAETPMEFLSGLAYRRKPDRTR